MRAFVGRRTPAAVVLCMHRLRAAVPLLVVLLALFTSIGCAPTVDLATNLEVQDITTGWYDAGIVNGQNKLVPSLTCRLKNTSDQKLVALQINAVFRRVTEKDEWGTTLVIAAGSDGLPPGAVTRPLDVRSPRGYTGSDQSREEMLHNSHFVDAKVELFAKYGSVQWKRIGEYPIARTLIAK